MPEPDLTPQSITPASSKSGWFEGLHRNRQKKIGIGLFLVVVMTGLGFLVYTTLSGASLFFFNVDEAVERRQELGGERFRVQGITVPESITRDADVEDFSTGERVSAVTFRIAFNGEVVGVVHRGGLADIFANCLPVILEGRWVQGGQDIFGSSTQYYFASSEMLVKHDNDYTQTDGENDEYGDSLYKEENPSRIDSAVGDEADIDPLRGCPQT